jgi:hypothetical protein
VLRWKVWQSVDAPCYIYRRELKGRVVAFLVSPRLVRTVGCGSCSAVGGSASFFVAGDGRREGSVIGFRASVHVIDLRSYRGGK